MAENFEDEDRQKGEQRELSEEVAEGGCPACPGGGGADQNAAETLRQTGTTMALKW